MTNGELHRRPGPDPRVVQTRQLVLAAARQLLLEEGQEAITPTKLAQVTGISRSTIYRHWNDSLDIVFEATAADTDQAPFTSTGDIELDLTRYLQALRDVLNSPSATLLATQIDRAEHDPTVTATVRKVAALRCSLIGDLAQHPTEDFTREHALIVGPLMYQRFLAREEITDELIELIVESYIHSRPDLPE